MNAAKTIRSLLARLGLGRQEPTAKPSDQAPPLQSPSPVSRVQSPTLNRRALLSSLGIMAVPWSVARALEAVLPFGDGWRFGWIFPQEPLTAKVYYGLDMADPERLVIYIERNELLTSVTMDQLKANHFEEAASEILISQGHRGLMLTGGLKFDSTLDDDEDFGEAHLHGGESETVMLEGTSDRDIEQAVQRAAHGRDATDQELEEAEDGPRIPPYPT